MPDILSLPEEFRMLESEIRPWGKFSILFEDTTTKVKRIVVKPGQVLSYQSHEQRNEDWVIVSGHGFVVLDGETKSAAPGSHFKINAKTKHRIGSSPDGEPLIFVEVQTGEYFGEDDIIRYEDNYGRER